MKWGHVAIAGVALLALAEGTRRAIGYLNGKPFELELAGIGGGFSLSRPAAQAFNAMSSAARGAGVELKVNSAFRTMAEQQQLRDQLDSGQRSAAVALPGWSNHQSGTAVDVETAGGTNDAFRWLTANAAAWGFRRTVSTEPWHWDYA